jgi:hypothetical protein
MNTLLPKVLLRIALLVTAAVGLSAAAQEMPPATSVLQPQAYVSLQPVPRGRSFQVAVVAKISPGFTLMRMCRPRIT